MGTEIGVLKNTGSREVELSLTRYSGGCKNGICVQLTATQEDGISGYIQLSTADIIALIPILKEHIIDVEMGIRKNEAVRVIKQYKELEKSIASDMREIAAMAIATPVLDMAKLLFFGDKKVELSDEIKREMEADRCVK
jgi:hypothetical protein